MTDRLKDLLVSSFDYYAQRTVDRLEGLTDSEYFWEPVDDCWSVRETDDGYTADWEWPAPEVPPVTTIGWRLVHIISFLSEHGLRAVAFEDGKAAWIAPSVTPGSAKQALAELDRAITTWKRDVQSVDDQRLWQPMGSEAGQYRDDPIASFVEHIHDEFIHHSAEVALLRDLYRAGRPRRA